MENALRLRVTRSLKGKSPAEVITIQTPTTPDIGEIGEEWIIMLPPAFLAGLHPYAGRYNIRLEPEIQAALAGE
jgi:hypothetical protein